MSQKRRDNRNRVLRTGESQKKDGRYVFKYLDAHRKPRFVYSWKLVETDRVPQGKRPCVALREREREILRDLEDGIDHLGGQMTVSQLYERYTRCRANVRPGTVRARGQLARLLSEDELGARRIETVKPSDARGWARRMSARGYAFATVNNHKRSLKAAFYTAVQDDLVRKNPFDFKLCEVVGNDTAPKVPLSAEQAEALLSFVRTDAVYCRYYDALVVLLGTGLRISELCGLTESDIDLEGRSIHVTHQLLRADGGGCRVTGTKTPSSVRDVYMGERVLAAMRRAMARRDPAHGDVIDGHRGFIFLNSRGAPMTGQAYAGAFRGMVRKYAKREIGPELPATVTPHTMRHTFCTSMALAGMNPKCLQYVMGHADIKMTLGYYAHVTSGSAMAEMSRFAP